ncbi:MAG: hypothetical protein ACFB9M_16025 [Myxococcota bacterium]
MKVPILFFAPDLSELPRMLRSAFTDPWVTSFQVGFGPPLVKSSTRLLDRLKDPVSALDKMDAYLECCLLNRDERKRLATEHRRTVVRRLGPVEAEALDRAAADAIDLRLRLRGADTPPDDVALDLWQALPRNEGPDEEARFLIRLDDPSGTRWLEVDPVRRELSGGHDGLALELQVSAGVRLLWLAWAEAWSKRSGYLTLGGLDLRPHARVIRNGESL